MASQCLAAVGREVILAWSSDSLSRVTVKGLRAVLELCDLAEASLPIPPGAYPDSAPALDVVRAMATAGETLPSTRQRTLVGLHAWLTGSLRNAAHIHMPPSRLSLSRSRFRGRQSSALGPLHRAGEEGERGATGHRVTVQVS